MSEAKNSTLGGEEQPRSQGLSSSRPSGKMRDPGNEVGGGAQLFVGIWVQHGGVPTS